MKLRNCLGGALSVGLLSVVNPVRAEEPPRPAAATEGHAAGFMVQGRLLAQGGLPYVGGGPAPGFLLGYQAESFALGLGLGLTRVGISAGNDGSGSLTLFQVMPTALVDVWRSRDGRARANLIGGVGYGRGSLAVKTTSQSCVTPGGGAQSCTTDTDEGKASASYVPLMLGFGGDYYLSRNFALGAEVGLQAAFTAGIDASENGVARNIDASGNLQLAYGALRATLVLGD
jgi:hypothetical protein